MDRMTGMTGESAPFGGLPTRVPILSESLDNHAVLAMETKHEQCGVGMVCMIRGLAEPDPAVPGAVLLTFSPFATIAKGTKKGRGRRFRQTSPDDSLTD